jgi:hypothetical protein
MARTASFVEALKRLNRDFVMIRYVAFLGLGSAFVVGMFAMVHTHRVVAQTPSVLAAAKTAG